MSDGSTRSDSATASPQVGYAGQAIECSSVVFDLLGERHAGRAQCAAHTRAVGRPPARSAAGSAAAVSRTSHPSVETSSRNALRSAQSVAVLDAPVLDEEPVEIPAVSLLLPAEVVGGASPSAVAATAAARAETGLDLAAKPVECRGRR